VRVLEGSEDGSARRVAIVAARFNEQVSRKLVDGAIAGLLTRGVADEDITLVWVPGAFEIPSVAARLASAGGHDAIICLGAVVRGETAHFELVAAEAARGIGEVSRDSGVPVIFEVLATNDLSQAEQRAGGSHGNKGWDAAMTALRMASLMEALGKEIQ
jgi:6,7-dimethyl-8-ribityllumazine synthase